MTSSLVLGLPVVPALPVLTFLVCVARREEDDVLTGSCTSCSSSSELELELELLELEVDTSSLLYSRLRRSSSSRASSSSSGGVVGRFRADS